MFGDGIWERTGFKVVAGNFALAGLQEAAPIEGGQLLIDLVKAIANVRLRIVALIEFYPRTFGQFANDFREGNALILLHEGKNVPMFTAPKALIKSLGGVDVKGGGLFVVKGTACLDGRSYAFDINAILADEVGEVDTVFNFG